MDTPVTSERIRAEYVEVRAWNCASPTTICHPPSLRESHAAHHRTGANPCPQLSPRDNSSVCACGECDARRLSERGRDWDLRTSGQQELSILKQAQVEPITQRQLQITRNFLRGQQSLTLDQVADHLLAGTLLHACALQGSLPMVQMLLNARADPNAVDAVRSHLPLS